MNIKRNKMKWPTDSRRLWIFISATTILLLFFPSFLCRYSLSGTVMNVMRVGIGYSSSVKYLDPASINTAFEYDILQNLYGRLLRYDQSGQLVADVPVSFSWSELEAKFEFGNKAITASGHVINARDAEISLKRLVFKGKSGHGDIRRFLCPGHKMGSLHEKCPGIRVEGNTLILQVAVSEYLPMLINTLEGADYSIIPKSSIDEITGELKDTSHRNTSGPFYVESDSEIGRIVMAANESHYLFHSDMPNKVEIVPDSNGGLLKGFIDGAIDYLPTSAYFTGKLGAQLVSDKKNEVHETLPVSITFMRFSPSARREFSIEQRLYAGLIAGSAFIKHYGSLGGRPTEQFFQVFSDGTLSEIELDELRKNRDRIIKHPPTFHKPIDFGVPESEFKILADELRSNSSIRVIPTKRHPISMKNEERPSMYYVMTDSAWAENLSLIGYNFESGTFNLPGLDPNQWFQHYISIRDKGERMKLLRKLHFDILQNASIVPVEVAPYFSVARAGWKLNQSKIMVGTELWAIRRN